MTRIQAQLSGLLGREVQQLRLTDEQPQQASIIDAAMAITRKNHNDAGQDSRRMVKQYPKVKAICFIYKFSGRRQRNTPVTDARGIVEIIMLLPGIRAARIRRQAAALMVRYMGGDLSLVNEVCTIRGFQEELATKAPEDPRRVFGEALKLSMT